MKKIFALLLTLCMFSTLCLNVMAENDTAVRLAALKGPTAMGLVHLLNEAENGNTENEYDFFLAGSADEITPKLIQGQIDIASVPVNLASVLYNKTGGQMQLLAVNTLGVVYIVEKGGESIQSIADLKGKTIYATGKGSTPEYSLTYIMAQNGIDISKDVTMEWKSEPTEVVALMNAQENAVAMLPQPYVTVAQTQVEGLRVALDLTQCWDELNVGSRMITAGIVARKEFVEQNPEAVEAFMKEFAASAAYANEDVAGAAQLIEKYGIVKAAVAQKALPKCNIVCITGDEMIAALPGYLQVLFDLNPAAVGGKLPAEDFYYVNEKAE